jgi:hypothetical protein
MKYVAIMDKDATASKIRDIGLRDFITLCVGMSDER